ncbi:MAG: cation-translocating P-type ATPase [Pseudomonadota bacterium]
MTSTTETTTPHEDACWHALAGSEALARLSTSELGGLSHEEAHQRLERVGPNRLPSGPRRSPLIRLLLQFHNPLIYVLLAAGLVTLALRHYIDAGVILGVVVINAIIGFIQEGKAEQALDAVRNMLASHANVVREGERLEIDAEELAPGDIVLLESGARVPADLRLLKVKNLRINEAPLTGESVPIEKSTEPLACATAVGDRSNMAHSGCVVSYGQAVGLVTATGSATEIGRIGTLVAGVESLATPLARRLDQFARQITLFILALGAMAFLYGHFVGGMPMLEVFLAVVGLAVAAIPEGLPAIVTITLAIGARAMAQRRALVRRLPAVESLGSITVICTDKTGTLTRNEMTVVNVMLPQADITVSGVGYAPEGGFHAGQAPLSPTASSALMALARCCLLCNDAHLHHTPDEGWTLSGDPTEGALITLARKAGLDPDDEHAHAPRSDEIPFESERRFMATLHHDHEGHAFILLKGAPESVLGLCVEDASGQSLDHTHWEQRLEQAARQGQRILALARCDTRPASLSLSIDDIQPRFTLLGLVGMIDPARPEAIEATEECRRAGIRVIMMTGDHAVTAAAVGRTLNMQAEKPLTGDEIDTLDEAGLARRLRETEVVARASPEHKLRLVAALQAQGELVAMTGDGVNDAPALKAADIGVAMGLRGTDAAREASALVLTDDNFATITRAVREGRRVFDNIKKSLLFILPTNGGEAGVILLAIFAGLALPITAGQILWINLVTTITLALALAFELAEDGVMQRPPRSPGEPIITRLLLARILYVSLLMIAVAFIVYEWELARGSSVETARTAVVNMLVMGEMVYLFNTRRFTASGLTLDTLYGNPVALWSAVTLIALQLLFTYTPPMQHLFHTTALDATSWGLILILALLKFLAVEVEKGVLRRLGIQRM